MSMLNLKNIGGAPASRIRRANDRSVLPEQELVLYWMIAARRPRFNFALDRACALARALGKPLLVFEALRVGYPWASDRLHRFVLDGMSDNEQSFGKAGVSYYPYVEPTRGAGQGLLAELASRACVVVTDEFPCFFLPRMVAVAAERLDVLLEVVDSNGLLPLAGTGRDFYAAAHFRRYAQKALRSHVEELPLAKPLSERSSVAFYPVPQHVVERWPRASKKLLAGDAAELARLPIDHEVPPVTLRGGAEVGRRALRSFVSNRLAGYAAHHNEPSIDGTSRLSPYLHFGHISAHEVFAAVADAEQWSPIQLGDRANGARRGFWGMSESAEAFLDQIVVWRELSYNTCAKRPHDYDQYESLPEWARATLEAHARDPRSHVYTRAAFEGARTHDELWNAAQRQLRREGWYHNYLRMLWGKKILEWSRTPREALGTMIHIMNRWSLDGRNPNSYAGYLWTLGRYDRPWPERAIYGKVRSMSSKRTRAKVSVDAYVAKFAPLAKGDA
ncbi:MAG TPA: deoxyribodipyrimidine photolyase [Polyangiaceae bacterium]|nr:deoxyribodipyrimidine photolyase [Polyangiaceae bacterium]